VFNNCPSDEELQQLLLDRLSTAKEQALDAHIVACPWCQHRLDLLTRCALPLEPSATCPDRSENSIELASHADTSNPDAACQASATPEPPRTLAFPQRKDDPMNKGKSEPDTVELPTYPIESEVFGPETGSARVQVDLAALSHPGLVRTNNEDHYLVVRYGRALETLLTSLPEKQIPKRSEEIGYGLVVADGIGGAAAGELASRMVISRLVSLVLCTPDWIISTEEPHLHRVMQRMAERFRQIDTFLRDYASGDPNLLGMGTTMTLACSLGATVTLGHIGDSRAYLYRDGELHQLTRDHTLVQSLVDLGRLTPGQAARHPHRHVLTHALGSGDHRYKGDFQRMTLVDSDQLLLCTDGLTDMVDNATLASALARAGSANEACQTLIAMALKNGGKDNVTVALARYRFPP
jgi:protein phosphatase